MIKHERFSALEGKSTLALTNLELLAIFVLTTYFLAYDISSASLVYEPSNSSVKHVIILFAAVLSLLSTPVNALKSILIFSPLALIYLIGGVPIYFLMVIIFAASLPFLSVGINALIEKRKISIILLLILISILPLINAISSLRLDVVLSEYYGRQRLLMGYWHPKDAAICFVVPILLSFLIYGNRMPKIFFVIAPLFLWIVGSRNLAITFFLIVFTKYYPKLTFVTILSSLLLLAFLLFSDADSYGYLNEFSSYRFDFWSDSLDNGLSVIDTELLGGERFSIDSYFLEVYALTGLAGIFIFFSWAFYFYLKYIFPLRFTSWSGPIFLGLLFFATFDSGIISSGNAFHVLAWGLICINVFNLKSTQRTSKKI